MKQFKVTFMQLQKVEAIVLADSEAEAIVKAKNGDWESVNDDDSTAENDYYEAEEVAG